VEGKYSLVSASRIGVESFVH